MNGEPRLFDLYQPSALVVKVAGTLDEATSSFGDDLPLGDRVFLVATGVVTQARLPLRNGTVTQELTITVDECYEHRPDDPESGYALIESYRTAAGRDPVVVLVPDDPRGL